MSSTEPPANTDSQPLDWDDSRSHWASQISGLAGIAGWSLMLAVLTGMAVAAEMKTEHSDEVVQAITVTLVGLIAYGTFLVTLLTTQAIASCTLPLSIRLLLNFLLIDGCLRLSTWSAQESISSSHVISAIPLCLGGFFQSQLRGWFLLARNQPPRLSRTTIGGLMDTTAAAALTLAALTTVLHSSEAPLTGLLCFAPGSAFLALIGMHGWARLCTLCPTSSVAESGYGIWLAVNVSIAFIVLLGYLAVYSQSTLALGAFVVAPSTLVVAHATTAIAIRWLGACGWSFVRVDDFQGLTTSRD